MESFPDIQSDETSLKSSRLLSFALGASVVSLQTKCKPSFFEAASNKSNTASQGIFCRKSKSGARLYLGGNLLAIKMYPNSLKFMSRNRSLTNVLNLLTSESSGIGPVARRRVINSTVLF